MNNHGIELISEKDSGLSIGHSDSPLVYLAPDEIEFAEDDTDYSSSVTGLEVFEEDYESPREVGLDLTKELNEPSKLPKYFAIGTGLVLTGIAAGYLAYEAVNYFSK